MEKNRQQTLAGSESRRFEDAPQFPAARLSVCFRQRQENNIEESTSRDEG